MIDNHGVSNVISLSVKIQDNVSNADGKNYNKRNGPTFLNQNQFELYINKTFCNLKEKPKHLMWILAYQSFTSYY